MANATSLDVRVKVKVPDQPPLRKLTLPMKGDSRPSEPNYFVIQGRTMTGVTTSCDPLARLQLPVDDPDACN
jgi:hypothetical protein